MIQPDLLIIYILVGLIFLLGGEMLVAIFAIVGLTRKMADMKQKEIHQKDNLLNKEEEIIEESKLKALKIIGKAEIDQQKLEEMLENKLNEVSLRVAENYEKKEIEMFNNVSKDIEKNLKTHLENTQKLLDQQIEATRAEKLKAIDNEIFNILRSVTQKALGKGLSFDEHQEFIFEALEKAKKENIFK